MAKKKLRIGELHAMLMYEIIVAHKRTNHHIFSTYYGHTDCLEIRISYNGWTLDNPAKVVFDCFRPQIRDLKNAINLIKSLK